MLTKLGYKPFPSASQWDGRLIDGNGELCEISGISDGMQTEMARLIHNGEFN
jgi:hypothetical protein